MPRWSRWKFVACLMVLAFAAPRAVADDYPRHQIKIMPFPGGAAKVAHCAPDGDKLLRRHTSDGHQYDAG